MYYIVSIVGLLGNDIIDEGKSLEVGKACKRINIRKCDEAVVGEDEGFKVGKGFTQVGCYLGDVVVAEEETAKTNE